MSGTRTESDSLGTVEVPAGRYYGAQTARLLADSSRNFAAFCVAGIDGVRPKVAENLERSLMLVTAPSPAIGYDKAAKLAEAAQKDGLSLREANRTLKVVDEAEFDRLTDPASMAHP